jgi:hypothetical protein
VTKCHKGAEKWHLVLLMLIFFCHYRFQHS